MTIDPGRGENIEEKVARFFLGSEVGNSPAAFYDAYDYGTFWKGRDFEHLADHIAVSRLLTMIPPPHRCLVDVGAGTGRMAPLYEMKWESFILLDPSKEQLRVAHEKLSHPEKAEFALGSAESIPLVDASCDTAICIRVFHYIESPRRAIRELYRILVPGGYLILEIPNKRHAKARLKALYSPRTKQELASRDPKHISEKNATFVFVNHDPEAIRDTLLTERFEIIETLSVSNFRHHIFKKILPLSWLLFFEKTLQLPFAKFWFGPSVYFLVRKKKNI
jgi:ubiquinone/menaquinone biosynthesis C-methylase UbiE